MVKALNHKELTGITSNPQRKNGAGTLPFARFGFGVNLEDKRERRRMFLESGLRLQTLTDGKNKTAGEKGKKMTAWGIGSVQRSQSWTQVERLQQLLVTWQGIKIVHSKCGFWTLRTWTGI